MTTEAEAKKHLVKKLEYDHCLETILALADDKAGIKWPSFLPLCNQLAEDGISLCNGTIKFRLNLESNSNRLFILPKVLTIFGVNDPRYWKWIFITDHITHVDAPQLIAIQKLDISGSIRSSLLTKGIPYFVSLLILLLEGTEGWQTPLNVSVTTPDGKTATNQVSLARKPIGLFFELIVGEFTLNDNGCDSTGVIKFSVTEYSNYPKKGMLIKGCIARAKFSLGCTNPTLTSA